MGKIVVDATGDLDVAASAGAPFTHGSYIVTTVFRLGGVDVDAAERFEYEEPGAFRAIDREAKRIIGGSWDKWWLKTPLPGIVWCNCPHMTGLDGIDVEDLTRADFEGRERIAALVAFVARKAAGLRAGVRRRRRAADRGAPDAAARRRLCDDQGRRDAATAFPRQRRARPRLLHPLSRVAAARRRAVAGRRPALFRDLVGATQIRARFRRAWRWARRPASPPRLRSRRMSAVDEIDVASLQARLRAQGADPGDRPAANAQLAIAAE